MEGYSLAQAATIAGGFSVGPLSASSVLTWVYDSRLPFREAGACFIALRGAQRAGLDFVESALERGVRLLCVASGDFAQLSPQLARWPETSCWVVAHPLAALQKLAQHRRGRLAGPTVGITGSNGKTIVKEWLYALGGGAAAGLYRSPASFNSQLGVALSVLAAPTSAEAYIFEAGISQAGEMSALADMIQPALGIFTKLGAAHDAGFADRRSKTLEKLKLFAKAKALIFSADDQELIGIVRDWQAGLPRSPELLTWMTASQANTDFSQQKCTRVSFAEGRLQVKLTGSLHRNIIDELWDLPCPFVDTASRENLVNAVLATFWLQSRSLPSATSAHDPGLSPKLADPGLPPTPAEIRLPPKPADPGLSPKFADPGLPPKPGSADPDRHRDSRRIENEPQAGMHGKLAPKPVLLTTEWLAQRMEELPTGSLRLQVYAGRDGIRLIDDSYSADQEGFRAAAQFFVQHARADSERVWFVGPLAGQTDQDAPAAARFIEDLAIQAGVHRLYLIGGSQSSFTQLTQGFADVEAAIAAWPSLNLVGASVLVKGPRVLRLDRLARSLREQSHDLRLELELSALAHNIAAYRAKLESRTRICVMVKAEGYGSGAPEVAAFFAARGVDYLAVAIVDEALALRQAGVRLPIIVAHVSADELELVVQHKLEPEVSDLAQLQRYAEGSLAFGAWLHLKFDTGMHRLGFDATGGRDSELPELLDALATGNYQIRSTFSHLSASELPAGDDFSRQQHERLVEVAERVTAVLGYRPWLHLLNSVGAWRLPEMQHDMVRLGLGVYGLGLEHIAPNALQPAHRLIAQLIQVRQVAAGEVVGYGLGGRAEEDRLIGVVNVGYADGLRRRAGHGRYALLVDGVRAPIVGSVCMDFTMIDLSDCPGASVGDEVEVFGAGQPVGVLAEACETIPYEIFTGIGQRVRRVYYR